MTLDVAISPDPSLSKRRNAWAFPRRFANCFRGLSYLLDVRVDDAARAPQLLLRLLELAQLEAFPAVLDLSRGDVLALKGAPSGKGRGGMPRRGPSCSHLEAQLTTNRSASGVGVEFNDLPQTKACRTLKAWHSA